MAICPGLTDTNIVSEAPRQLLQEEWGYELKRELDKLPNEKWVLVTKVLPFKHSSYTRDFPWLHGCKIYNFVSMQKMTSDFFVLGYLRTLFQLDIIGRISWKCLKNRVQLIVLN